MGEKSHQQEEHAAEWATHLLHISARGLRSKEWPIKALRDGHSLLC